MQEIQDIINDYEELESKGENTLKLIEKVYMDFFKECVPPLSRSSFKKIFNTDSHSVVNRHSNCKYLLTPSTQF